MNAFRHAGVAVERDVRVRMRDGVVERSNALELMRSVGLEV